MLTKNVSSSGGSANSVGRHVAAYFHEHKKALLISLVGFSLLVVVAIGPAMVQAVMTLSAQRAEIILQKNNAMETAILNNDYVAWESLTDDKVLKSKINSSNFAQFAQAYRLLQQGKIDEANIIKKNLSLKQDFAMAAVKSQSIDSAISTNNYAAWRAIVGPTVERAVTAGNFSQYASAYRLILEGKLRQASYIKDRIGLSVDFNVSSSR